jgi:hypothetical protein
VLAFVGFETAGTYAEEVTRPRREAGRAAYASIVVLILTLAASAWATAVAAGPDRVGPLAATRGTELPFDLAAARLAPWAVTLGRVMLLTGLAGAVLGLHYAISRYLFALGREGVLPGFLARVSPRTGAPRAASIVQSLLAAAVIATGYLFGPVHPATLGRNLITWGGMGVLLLVTATSLAALLHLNRVPEHESAWSRFFAPLLSTVSLAVLCFLAFRDQPVRVPILAGGIVALGTVQALLIRVAKPVAYAGIGQAGAPVVITPAAPRLPRPRLPGAHRAQRSDLARTTDPADLPSPGRKNGDLPSPGRKNGDLPSPGRKNGDLPSPGRKNGDLPSPGRGDQAGPGRKAGPGEVPSPGRGGQSGPGRKADRAGFVRGADLGEPPGSGGGEGVRPDPG